MAPLEAKTIMELFTISNTPIPETVLKHLDTDSFLAFRQVSKDWDQIWWDNLRVCLPHHGRVNRMLAYAAAEGLLEMVRHLLSRGLEVDAQNSFALCAPLHYASTFGHLEVVRLLLDNGAHIDARTASQFTPLHEATKRGHLEVVRLLLKNGADVNARAGLLLYTCFLGRSGE